MITSGPDLSIVRSRISPIGTGEVSAQRLHDLLQRPSACWPWAAAAQGATKSDSRCGSSHQVSPKLRRAPAPHRREEPPRAHPSSNRADDGAHEDGDGSCGKGPFPAGAACSTQRSPKAFQHEDLGRPKGGTAPTRPVNPYPHVSRETRPTDLPTQRLRITTARLGSSPLLELSTPPSSATASWTSFRS